MNDKHIRESIALLLLSSLVVISSFFLVLSVMSPSGESFSEMSVLGPQGLAEAYPAGFSSNSSYQVVILVRNFEGQVEFYQISIKLEFEDGQTLGFTPSITFADGTQMGRFIENKGSWKTTVTITNGSKVLDRQNLAGQQPLKIKFLLLIYHDGGFHSTGSSVHIWAQYPA